MQAQLPPAQRPRVINIFDREGAVHEVFAELLENGDGAVIRCAQDRRVEGPLQYAHATVRAALLLGIMEFEVPRKKGTRKTRNLNVFEIDFFRVIRAPFFRGCFYKGNITRKVVPFPSSLSTSMRPLCACTIMLL